MFIITATPVSKSFGQESLSYFSANPIQIGSIISVPLRKSVVPALVLNSEEARDYKAELRSSDFALKKIGSVRAVQFFSPSWMRATLSFARFHAIPEGQAISSLMPSVVLNNIESLKLRSTTTEKGNKPKVKSFVLEAYHGRDEERFSHYKSIIREEFARGRSVMLCLSTGRELDTAKQTFEKGIEKYVFVWKPKMEIKELKRKFAELVATTHPVLIISSVQWMFLQVPHLGTVIVDNESSGSWRSVVRPFVDFRKFVRFFAEEADVRLLLGDIMLSAESLWEYQSEDRSLSSFSFRQSWSNANLLVDMKREKPSSARPPLVISDVLLLLIRETVEQDKNIFIYAARKGLSSTTVCQDCGEGVSCQNCGSPVVLYKGKDGNIFKCRQCGQVRSASEVCKNCGSWRLLPLGIGVERVAEEVKKILPESHPIFELNKDVAPSSTKAQLIADKFYKTPGSVMIGTEMALDYLGEPVSFSVIASIDSLFSVPDFRIREKIFHILLQTKLLGREKFLVQVRNAEKETISLALSGNLAEFYRREIKERQEMGYPPFSVFVKVTARGLRSFVEKEMRILEKIFAPWNPAIFQSSAERGESAMAMNCILKLARNVWPNDDLHKLLLSLPPHFEIKVNPDNLL